MNTPDHGLIVNGARVPVPGVSVVTWLDDPARCPVVTKGSRREASTVTAIVAHTSRGKRGVIEGASRVSGKAAKLARYQVRTARKASWHITIGAAGDVYQQADAATFSTWHATHANPWSVGIELAQDADTPNLTHAQVNAFVAVVKALCAALSIPTCVPIIASGGVGEICGKPVRAWQSRKQGGEARAVVGVIGHRNLTTSRGVGDPGDGVFVALLTAGFTGVGVDAMTLGASRPQTLPAVESDDAEEAHDDDAPSWPPLPSWIDPALEVDASEDLPVNREAFANDGVTHLAALGVSEDRAVEVVAHWATECGWGRRAHGFNMGGVKLKERDDASHRKHHGRGLGWWRDEGHVESGDPPVVYYRAFDDAPAFWAWWLARYAPRDADPAERYAATGRAFWNGGDWFVAMLLAGYRGTVRQAEVKRIVDAGGDVGAHLSVAAHDRVVNEVRALVALPSNP